MASCRYTYDSGAACGASATTTLTKGDGEVVQLCEGHRELLVATFRAIAGGEIRTGFEGEVEAAWHWFALNGIPV